MERTHDSIVARQFGMRFSIACICYVLGLGSLSFLTKHHALSQTTIELLSLIPAAGILGMIWAFGIFLTNLEDEFQRDILQKALIGATGCILALTSIYGSIETFVFVPRLAMFFVFPAFWFFFGLCAFIVRIHYGSLRTHE